MRSRYRTSEGAGTYFITSTIVEWLPVFTSARYSDIITDSLRFCREQKGLSLHSYVVMDNHLHLLVSAPEVTSVMRDFKSYTSKKIVAMLEADEKEWLLARLEFFKRSYKTESHHQVWQEGFHPQLVTTEEMLRQKADYIHQNPVRRGLVSAPEHWVYSSASNYHSGTGLLEIDILT